MTDADARLTQKIAATPDQLLTVLPLFFASLGYPRQRSRLELRRVKALILAPAMVIL
jgi:hypothetical protein